MRPGTLRHSSRISLYVRDVSPYTYPNNLSVTGSGLQRQMRQRKTAFNAHALSREIEGVSVIYGLLKHDLT